MQVIIRKYTGKTFFIEAEASDQINVIKEKIYRHLDINPEDVTECRLIYAGKVLEDNRTLSDYNISKEEADLTMRLTMREKNELEHVSDAFKNVGNAMLSFWNTINPQPQPRHPAQQEIPVAAVPANAPAVRAPYAPAVRAPYAPAVVPAAAEVPDNLKLSELVDSDSDTPDTSYKKAPHR